MEQQNQQELRGLFHMLEHTAKIAEDAALTGAFQWWRSAVHFPIQQRPRTPQRHQRNT